MPVPRISVVTSVYNGERYLRESLESVLSQEGVDLELIVVDDGSEDSTPEILADSATRDPRLRVLTQENRGLTVALIRGCAEARGEFIARHDLDDLSLPGRLRR
jgi:glycosyltransferase involved in cell wall biosynthesis